MTKKKYNPLWNIPIVWIGYQLIKLIFTKSTKRNNQKIKLENIEGLK